MAAVNNDTREIDERIDELTITKDATAETRETERRPTAIGFEPHLSGFETRELYKIALNFYKEKEGKAVHLSYEDKLKLVAFTQQITHGKCTADNSAPPGVLDVIGRDRRLAWQNLGDITREQAMEGFIVLLDRLCPLFKTVVEAQKRDVEEKARLKKELERRRVDEERREAEAEAERKRAREERAEREHQRRRIQEALNQQTYYQFRAYAEQQYPGNPEQQAVLIRQLQEQHYHRYMQQLHQNGLVVECLAESGEGGGGNNDDDSNESNESSTPLKREEGESEDPEEVPPPPPTPPTPPPDWPPIEPAKMWTGQGVAEFKETIRREAGDAVIKVGHGETVTVRVPTHEDGSCLFWEFATDGYDIGFGVYFEWSKPDTNQVSVHISESEDDEDEDDEDYESREDLESGANNGDSRAEYKPSSPPISVIVPVYRRDSQEEVYAGSHQYPGQGVYLLKFDNSYSLWRSKTLYYRVYYTRPGFAKD